MERRCKTTTRRYQKWILARTGVRRRWGVFRCGLYGSRELYHQTFSSVASDRNSESLTDVQRNPSQQIGFVGTWSRLFAERHKMSAGFEAQDVRGHSARTNYTPVLRNCVWWMREDGNTRSDSSHKMLIPSPRTGCSHWRTRRHLEQQHRLSVQTPALPDRHPNNSDVPRPFRNRVQPQSLAAEEFFARNRVECFGISCVSCADSERALSQFPSRKCAHTGESGAHRRALDRRRGRRKPADPGRTV